MVETIKKQTYFIILISAILPLLVFNLIIFTQFRNNIQTFSSTQIESVRSEWLERYNFEYNRLFERIDNMTLNNKLDRFPISGESIAVPGYFEFIKLLITEEKGVSEVAFFDDTYKPVFKVDNTGYEKIAEYSPPVRLALQEIVFPGGRVTGDVQMPDGTSALYVFYKFTDLEKNIIYAAWRLDYGWLNNTLPQASAYVRSIFNDKYQLIASNDGSLLWSSQISEQTERMLDGFSETEIFAGKLHSYGFIDLGQTAIYGDINLETKSLYPHYRAFAITAVFFILFTFLMAVIFARSFSGRLISYGESILIKNHYTSEMKFFRRLGDNVNRIREDVDTINTMQTRLGYLLNDLDTLEGQLPPADVDKKNR